MNSLQFNLKLDEGSAFNGVSRYAREPKCKTNKTNNMNDFEMMCELIARKIFQCDRFNDPLGRLANTDSWSGLLDDKFSVEHKCMAWAIISRLKNEYLDSADGREEMFERSNDIDSQILNSISNEELRDAMKKIWEIVEELNLNEYPHIAYQNTNDI
jgi:hypothetical protein